MKKFTIIGLGNRGFSCFGVGILNKHDKGQPEFPELADIVSLVDSNHARAEAAAVELELPGIPIFDDVAVAQKELPADWAIVTTPDYTHRDVVCSALDSGLNVMVDKPLATSVMECNAIIDKMNETGKKVIVGHNMRYQQNVLAACEMLRAGKIGKVISVEATEALDYNHGGDYFHRWHSDFSKSAGLLNHKACHHLDILNWMIDDEPVAVSAMGSRTFYRPRPDLDHGERCSECNISDSCPHFFDFDKWDGYRRRLYKDAEHEDGYKRDLCCFSDRHTVNDHEVLNIEYKSGILATFTLLTFAPKEHWFFYVTGTEGRLEVGVTSDGAGPYLRVINKDGSVEEVDYEREAGEHGHGGADVRLIADLLGLEGSLPLQRAEPYEALRAVAIADMASRSMVDGGRLVRLDECGKDYPPAPLQD